MAEFPKDTTSPEIYKKLFSEAKEKHEGHRFIYTDGSKTDEGVGLAVVSEEIEMKWKLPKCASIFTAELWAVVKAVEICKERKEIKKWMICTDSMSVATALKDIFASDPLIRKILENINEIEKDRREIKIMWIPSHIGIRGNERVDQAARTAITNDSPVLPLRMEDQIHEINKEVNVLRQNQWEASGTKLRQILDTKDEFLWPQGFTRKERILIIRLTTGHTRLTHSHLLLGIRPPVCPQCAAAALSVRHIFTECIALEQQRQSNHITGTLKEILIDSSRYNSVIQFLKNVKLFVEL